MQKPYASKILPNEIKWFHNIFDGAFSMMAYIWLFDYFLATKSLINHKQNSFIFFLNMNKKKLRLTVFNWIFVLQNTQIRCVTVKKRVNKKSMSIMNNITNFKHALLYTRWLFSSVPLVKRPGLQRLYQRYICSGK